MGMWDNFAKEDDNLDEISSAEEKEPIKLIDSVGTLVALTNRSRELSAEILSGIDKEQSLSKQLSTLNIDELNKAASKETTYKTEEEFDNAYMNQVLNHNNNDLFKSSSNFAVSTERKKRYEIYEQMLDSNFIVERVLEVFCENIIIRNAQTKSYINTQINDNKTDLFSSLGNDVQNSYDKLCKALLVKYKLQKQLKDTIVPNVCTFGNYFVEIVDLNLLSVMGGITAHEQVIMDSSGQTMVDQNGVEYKSLTQTSIVREEILVESTIEKPKDKKDKKDQDREKEKVKTTVIFESNFDCFESEEDLLITIKNNEFKSILNSSKEIHEDSKDIIQEQEHSVSNIDNFLNELLQENTLDHIDLGFFDQMDLENSPDNSDLKHTITLKLLKMLQIQLQKKFLKRLQVTLD